LRITLQGQPRVAALVVQQDRREMPKVTNIGKVRAKQQAKAEAVSRHAGFTPCSQDMTICGDCADNRAKRKCPRMQERPGQRRS
jgi:hypothetical protein